MAQEVAFEFTGNKREVLRQRWRNGWRIDVVGGVDMLTPPAFGSTPDIGEEIPEHVLDLLQPEIAEYDPVIQLVLVGVDYNNSIETRLRANGLAAEYMHPKLKSIELLDDGDTKELMDERNELAGRLVHVLEAMAADRRQRDPEPITIDGQAEPNGHANGNGNGNGHDKSAEALRREIEGDDDDDDESDPGVV